MGLQMLQVDKHPIIDHTYITQRSGEMVPPTLAQESSRAQQRGARQGEHEPRRRRARLDVTPYVLSSAAALYLALFLVLPLGRGAWLSLTDTRLLNPTGGDFVGMQNYQDLLASGNLPQSLGLTVVYTAGTVLSAVLLGSAAALAVNATFKGRAIVRGILIAPWAVPAVAVSLIFSWMYNPDNGVLNRIVAGLGGDPQQWLVNPDLAMFAVIVASVWKVTPFVMLVVLAALQSVPEELLEAARIDGANAYVRLRAVVIPHVLPTIKIVSLLMTVWSIRRFEIIWLLTGGGPSNATNTLVINVFREAFQNSRLGSAAAIGIVGLMLSVAVTIVYFAAERRAGRDS